jgi:hypothetical protein
MIGKKKVAKGYTCSKPIAEYKRRNDETPEGETPTGVRFNNLAWQ